MSVIKSEYIKSIRSSHYLKSDDESDESNCKNQILKLNRSFKSAQKYNFIKQKVKKIFGIK